MPTGDVEVEVGDDVRELPPDEELVDLGVGEVNIVCKGLDDTDGLSGDSVRGLDALRGGLGGLGLDFICGGTVDVDGVTDTSK